MDLGHAVARALRQPGLRHHVNEVGQRLVLRVYTTRVRLARLRTHMSYRRLSVTRGTP